MGEEETSRMPDLRQRYLTGTMQVFPTSFGDRGQHASIGVYGDEMVFPRERFVEFYGFGGETNMATEFSYGGESTTEKEIYASSGSRRWARQETQTLLEIRSRLDPKFKEATHKGHLWDEVSRKMAEEYGYNRNGRKCREKFENLYKYYKKTKESKAGRADGKHYRFFHQLESIYGETSKRSPQSRENQRPFQELKMEKQSEDTVTPGILQKEKRSELECSSNSGSYEDDGLALEIASAMEKKKGWKMKVKEFVDVEMRKVVETQELWMEKTMKAVEEREQRRLLEEEERRNRETAMWKQEREFWARERALIEAQDNELMKVLDKFLRERGGGEGGPGF